MANKGREHGPHYDGPEPTGPKESPEETDPRLQPRIGEEHVGDNEEQSAEDLTSVEDGACPVCGVALYEGPCEHLVSTWDYSDGGGMWAGSSTPLEDLERAAKEFTEELGASAYDYYIEPLIELLIPEQIACLIEEGRFNASKANGYLGSLICGGPTFVGSTDGSSCSPAGSSWTNYWATDAAKCARHVESIVSKAVETFESAKTLLKTINRHRDDRFTVDYENIDTEL